jgi:hypothetical protein
MSDERLAQFSIAALSPFPFDHPATRIVTDAFAELVAEVKRARGEVATAIARAERAEAAGLNSQQAQNERFNVLRGSNFALRVEIDQLEARLAGLGEYYIGSDSQDDSAHWAYVTHQPCGRNVWTGRYEPTNPDMATLLSLMAAHRCKD